MSWICAASDAVAKVSVLSMFIGPITLTPHGLDPLLVLGKFDEALPLWIRTFVKGWSAFLPPPQRYEDSVIGQPVRELYY